MPSSLIPTRLLIAPGWLRLGCLFIALLSVPAAAVAQTGTVTGTVTNAVTGLPVPNITVAVLTQNAGFVSTDATDATGAYSVTVPQGAVYYVAALANTQGFVPQAHPGIPCPTPNCTVNDVNLGNHIAVASGATVSGIDFALTPGGRITGTVTNASTGAPAANVFVFAVFQINQSTFSVGDSTDASGVYDITGLPAATYFLATSAPFNSGLRNEIYDNVPCVISCPTTAILASGAPVVVTSGATVSGRNFSLEVGGTLRGTVTNAATGAPLQSVAVSAATRVGASIFTIGAITNAAGEYSMVGLGAADFAVFTNATSFVNEIHDGILCPLTCNATAAADSGVRVPVALGGTASVNFALDPGGSISGTVTNEAAGTPVTTGGVFALFRTSSGFNSRAASLNASGAFTISGLPAGSYTLATSGGGFINEVFDNIACPATGCSTAFAGNAGTLIDVPAGGSVPGRNFALQPLPASSAGSIAGTITDGVSGLPIGDVQIQVWQAGGASVVQVRGTSTDVNGQYNVTGLPTGSYFVSTGGVHPYQNEAFDNLRCTTQQCAPTTILAGAAVSVTGGGTATASFALSIGDSISGLVTDAATGAPLANVNVAVWEVSTGSFAGSGSTNGSGRYHARGLRNGTYVLLTTNSVGYANKIYDNIACPVTCSIATALASGTQVTLTSAGALAEGDTANLVSGINFALNRRSDAPGAPSGLRIVTTGGTAQFAWTAPSVANGGAPTSYVLEAGGSPGTTFITLPMPGTGTTFSVPGVPPGTYFVRVRGVNAAGTGAASNEVTLVVGAGGTGLPEPPTNVIAFMSGGLLTMTWSPALGGGPATGFVIEAGPASGASNITLNVTDTRFTFNPVPPGFYFLRVRARNAAGVSAPSTEIMINVGNVPAPPGPPTITTVEVSGSTVTINWSAPLQGTATSYIIEAGSAPGLANLATVNTGSTALTQTFGGVPPGVYYVRVRAVNAQGASLVSNERIITVS